MKALFRMVFGRKGHKGCASRRDEYALRASDERRVTSDELAVENRPATQRFNDPAIQRFNDSTVHTTATTEETTMNMHHAQDTMQQNGMRMGAQGRATAKRGRAWARWAAVAAGGRGMRLEGARETHTEALRHGEGRGGHMGRMGHTGLMGHMARWAAVAAVAVAGGLLLGSAREAEAGRRTGGAAA